ncbi:hypothetical protein CC86DRAFT_156521 [Ophiobolus disseminans]|uniref:Uncharacterized protein n=1 Tax=Ophiobolus disseminans TaxID=1469910 RepID=A0A6A6ZCS9_9PLEO|nr:hypothetical protein CC86DRAFT_156521 [Ophiobolus disseminans]
MQRYARLVPEVQPGTSGLGEMTLPSTPGFSKWQCSTADGVLIGGYHSQVVCTTLCRRGVKGAKRMGEPGEASKFSFFSKMSPHLAQSCQRRVPQWGGDLATYYYQVYSPCSQCHREVVPRTMVLLRRSRLRLAKSPDHSHGPLRQAPTTIRNCLFGNNPVALETTHHQPAQRLA